MMNFMQENWEWLLAVLALIVALIGGIPGLLKVISFFESPYELRVNFVNVAVGEMDEGTDHYSTVFLTMTITNKGEKPFTPAVFDFEYKKDRKWIRFERRLIPDDLTLGSVKQNITLVKPHEKDLQRFNKPISYAFPVQGFLFFVSKEITLSELRRKNQLRLICTDIFDKQWIREFKIGDELTRRTNYPKHGIEVSLQTEQKASTAITVDAVKNYFSYFLENLQKQPEIIEYSKKYANSSIVYPEKIQFILTTSGTVIVHVGNAPARKTSVEFHSLNIPYQQAMFAENINIGEPAFTIKRRHVTLDYLVIGQKLARTKYPAKIDSIGGVGRYGDRLIDVSPDADVTLLNCFFHFVRDGHYESLSQDYIYISGTTDDSVISKEAADQRIEHICSILKNRNI